MTEGSRILILRSAIASTSHLKTFFLHKIDKLTGVLMSIK